MENFIKTNIQKVILLIGGLIIFFKLLNVEYHKTYNAILSSAGILILTIILLILFKNIEFKDLIKYKKIFIVLMILILIGVLIIGGRNWYVKDRFYTAETNYQKCLDKVESITQWKTIEESNPISDFFKKITWKHTIRINSFWEQWINDGRPNDGGDKGHYEWGFMGWMMKNNSDFCSEFDTTLIKYYLTIRGKEMGIDYLK